MKFFKELKDELEELASDMTTIEHAMVRKKNDGQAEVLIYRKQEIDGDSVIYITSDKLEQETIQNFNKLFQAGMISRQGILMSMIKIFKP